MVATRPGAGLTDTYLAHLYNGERHPDSGSLSAVFPGSQPVQPVTLPAGTQLSGLLPVMLLLPFKVTVPPALGM